MEVAKPRTRLRLWFFYFLFILTMSTGLSLITPYYGGADEPAHFVYLYTVLDGNIPMNSDSPNVPEWLNEANPDCWKDIEHENQPATCSGEVSDSDNADIPLLTTAANYPPLYYLLVGWPIKFLSGDTALRTIRFLSSILFAAFAALGLSFLRTNTTRYRSDILAFLLITPSTYALAGFVQPQALEIGAAIALAGILLPLSHTPEEVRLRLTWAIPITFLLVASRTTGMWWALMICVLVLISLKRNDILALIKKPILWIFVATSALWCSLSLWWMLGTKDWYDLRASATTAHTCDITSCILPSALRPSQFAAATAVTGWNDTLAPRILIMLYWIVVAVVIALAAKSNTRKTVIATLFLIVLYLLSSIIMSISWVDIYGSPIWQARYALPIILAYFLYIADIIGQSSRVSPRLFRWLTRLSSFVLALLFAGLALRATLRFWSGIGNGVDMLHGPAYAPLHAQIGLALCILACLALCLALWYGTRPSLCERTVSDSSDASSRCA